MVWVFERVTSMQPRFVARSAVLIRTGTEGNAAILFVTLRVAFVPILNGVFDVDTVAMTFTARAAGADGHESETRRQVTSLEERASEQASREYLVVTFPALLPDYKRRACVLAHLVAPIITGRAGLS